MIFFSNYPTGKSDGMLERVKFIDDIFKEDKRTYISLSFFSNSWAEVDFSNLKIIKANPIFHFKKVKKLIHSEKIFYAHSLVNAYKALIFKPSDCQLIFDVHGAVPEEAEYLRGSIFLRMIYDKLERLVLKKSALNIVVSNMMEKHLRSKHSRVSLGQFTLLPIFGNVNISNSLRKIPGKVVYAGGVQKWQNVELMLELIRLRPDLSYLILTPHPGSFEAIKHLPNVIITYSQQSELHSHYESAEFGLILRDDHILNKVACPTKLIEYLSLGVIPIVLTKEIGDFASLGYKSIDYHHMRQGNLRKYNEQDAAENYAVINKIKLLEEDGVAFLKAHVRAILSC